MRSVTMCGILVVGLALAGCSTAADDVSSDDGAGQEIGAATILVDAKLYDDPKATPDAFCDRYTRLTVSSGRDGKLVATLENKLAGSCELFVPPNPRSFAVTSTEDCGSTVYQGKGKSGVLEVQDNRTRVCEDLRPSTIEVKETVNGNVHAMFGEPSGAPPGAENPDPTSKVLTVKLYGDPQAKPNADCDRYLELVIGAEGSKLVATLDSGLSPTSTCEIAVVSNPRTYDVKRSTEACGSTIYEGSRGADKLRVQDNAGRSCEDLRAARVEVSETRAGKQVEYFGNP